MEQHGWDKFAPDVHKLQNTVPLLLPIARAKLTYNLHGRARFRSLWLVSGRYTIHHCAWMRRWERRFAFQPLVVYWVIDLIISYLFRDHQYKTMVNIIVNHNIKLLYFFMNAPFKIMLLVSFHSTVTDFARLRGWSTSVPLATAVK